MNTLTSLASHSFARELAWWLFHLTWATAAASVVLALALAAMRDRGPAGRYRAVLVAMLASLAIPSAVRGLAGRGALEAWLAGGPDRGAAQALAAPWLPRWTSSLEGALPLLALVWAIGVQLWLGRGAYQWLCAQRLRRRGVERACEPLRRLVTALGRELRVRARVRVLESTLARVPAVVGWWSPVLLVPVGLATNLPPHQLRAILAHELAHVRRHDYLIALFQALFEALLFFHPLAWWMSSRLSEEREYCCDDVAVRLCADPLVFARALSSMEAFRSHASRLSLASNGGPLMKRILRLVGAPAPHRSRGPLTRSVLALCLALPLAPAAVGLEV